MSASPYVTPVGHVTDADGIDLYVAADCSLVTIGPEDGPARYRLDSGQREELDRLLWRADEIAADWGDDDDHR